MSFRAKRGICCCNVKSRFFVASLLGMTGYGGQMYPVPVGDLKQPTDSGRNCFGSHSTTLGNSTVKAMVKKKTTYSGSERTSARLKGTPTYFAATNSDRPYGGVIRPNTSTVMITTPMCTGLMLPTSVSLLMIGMKMMIAGTASMKSPTITNSTTSRNMIIAGSVPAIEVM